MKSRVGGNYIPKVRSRLGMTQEEIDESRSVGQTQDVDDWKWSFGTSDRLENLRLLGGSYSASELDCIRAEIALQSRPKARSWLSLVGDFMPSLIKGLWLPGSGPQE
jgi:hypothetical protein